MTKLVAFLNRCFGPIGSLIQSPLLLVLRLYFGLGFVITGASKLQDIGKFTGYLTSLHIPYPEFAAWATALTETVGGVLLILGLLSRLASIPLITVMCVAYVTAHADVLVNFWKDPTLFVSAPPFNFLLTSLLVFAFGPGRFSIDAALCNSSLQEKNK